MTTTPTTGQLPGPGYELNLAVARKKGDKFNLDHDRYLAILNSTNNTKVNDGRGIYMRCDACGLGGYGNEVDWTGECPTPVCRDYSTDWDAAMSLIEMVGQKYPTDFRLIRDSFSKSKQLFEAIIEVISDKIPYKVYTGNAETGPHAICLAFLTLPDDVLKGVEE